MKKSKPAKFMEVCGTHTFALSKFALKKFYGGKIEFLSGPGCPVCVTSQQDIDYAVQLAENSENIVVSFGDMVRVPSSNPQVSLEKFKKQNVKTIYSVLDVLNIAVENPSKNIVFIAVGFETTVPLIASLILDAHKRKLNNFYIFCSLKTIVPALKQLLSKKQIKADGFILPGHVCTVTGYEPFEFIAQEYKIPCVVAGFEFEDLKKAVDLLYSMHINKTAELKNCYAPVTKNGNIKALKAVAEVFESETVKWRGLGIIGESGLKLRKKYEKFDITKKIARKNSVKGLKSASKCICGSLFTGKYKPSDCPSFAKECTPLTPAGPCMVSSEGVCASYYKYGDKNEK